MREPPAHQNLHFNKRRKTMDDFFEDFNGTKAGEIAVGVFLGLVAFKLAGCIARACFE
jgi:hypothetical protein